jgi:hypothetical protein
VEYVRTALYLDFDNVFTGMFNLDPEVAIQFASDPGAWLRRLSTTSTTDASRRWLILRCYLNPSGWVNHRDPDGKAERLYFSRFRPSFVRAGFEVIDCPRYSATKNGADIRIVIDAVDALSADTLYEEFVIASGDSDMAPLLQRLRRADRRTVIVSPADAAEAFTSIADQVLGSRQLLALVSGEHVDFDDDADMTADTEGEDCDGGVTHSDGVSVDHDEAYMSFRSKVLREYNEAPAPINMATLAGQLRSELGDVIAHTDWFGHGGFARAVESLNLPNLCMSQHYLWDKIRHTPPDAVGQVVALPEPVERLTELFSLPRLPSGWWPAIYQTLSAYAHSHQFNLAHCISWSRDQLQTQGLAVSRKVIEVVLHGTANGGCPLYRQPSPTEVEIGMAFVKSMLSRADQVGLAFTYEEEAAVRAWLGAQLEDNAGGAS